MSFDSAQHPRATDGTFTEKTGSAPEVGLNGGRETVTANIRHNIFDDIGVYHGYDETGEFEVEALLDDWTLDEVKTMREDSSYARLYAGIIQNKLTDEFFTQGQRGEVHVSDAAVDAYIADREAREKPKPETRASKSGAFGAMHTLHDVDQSFAAFSSPENLYMDGEVGQDEANRRYAHYAAGYVARAAEVAKDWDYHAAVQQSVDAMLGAGRPTRTNDGIIIHAQASGMGANATLFSGGKPDIEASGRDTVLITKTRGGTVKVPAGSNPTIIVSRDAMTSIEVEDGASALVVSDSPNLDLADKSGVTFVGRKRGVHA